MSTLTWQRSAALLAGLWFAGPAWPAETPRAWLDRMNRAVEYLNYEGTLVHVHETETAVLRIVHRVDRGKVSERISSADKGREIVRTDNQVLFIMPDQRSVLIEEHDSRSRQQSPLRASLPVARSINSAYYGVAFAGVESVAGRRTQVLAIRPKDHFRYGYRLSLDRATSMPLKTQLIDELGRLLEQILFTEIKLPQAIASEAVAPSVPLDTLVPRRSTAGSGEREPTTGPWAATSPPPGFRMTVPQARQAATLPPGVRHMVYSDGLATVSLFIEPAVAASEQAVGLSQIGATHAYTVIIDDLMVTAVGDAPARTVEQFARSARPEVRRGSAP